MPTNVQVPSFGDAIVEATLAQWLKKVGDPVKIDEPVAELESEKSTIEVLAPKTGVLTKLNFETGAVVPVGTVIAEIDESGAAAPAKAAEPQAPAPASNGAAAHATSETKDQQAAAGKPGGHVMPAANRVLGEKGIPADQVSGTGPGGRVLKEDALRHEAAPVKPTGQPTSAITSAIGTTLSGAPERTDERKAMSTIRRAIAQRLVEAQQTAALLTTFNEVDMSPIMALRKQYQDQFVEKYNTKLGFMSFFVKATIDALYRFPAVNSEIQGNDVIQHNYVDMGIAVGGGKGLVVPVLRNAERMSFAEIEVGIGELAKKAQANKLKPSDLEGGTFTISNGGVYGSMLSTPIVNPPQSGVLGMHAIQDRAVVKDGQVVVRPMMYLALTYDHRIIDGREAVSFLKRIKECIENPLRLMLEV